MPEVNCRHRTEIYKKRPQHFSPCEIKAEPTLQGIRCVELPQEATCPYAGVGERIPGWEFRLVPDPIFCTENST